MEEKQNWNPGDNYAQAIELEWSKKNVFSTFAYDCLGCVYGNSSSQRIFLKGEKKREKGSETTRKHRKKLIASAQRRKMTCKISSWATFQTDTLKTTKNVKLHPVQVIPTLCQDSLTPGTANEDSFSCPWKKPWYKLIRNNFSSFLWNSQSLELIRISVKIPILYPFVVTEFLHTHKL